ncbi:MAG: hypothetical protein HC851_23290 [Acaryochloris sp. RU_4_1]|nr:hypothetical protein [Acaryochloris sp. RU_4_1]NJR56957.1 hypothetical protein [Acaryochloris sp. CRU_2_0]
MSDARQRENIRIRRQPLIGSREAEVMNTARAFYGGKFSEKAGLMLVDLLEPLHVAATTRSEQQVQDAIARSLDEIRGWHREALNQCQDSQNSGYVFSSQVVQENGSVNYAPANYDPDDDEPELEFD